MASKQTYGRIRTENQNKKKEKGTKRKARHFDTADLVFLLGTGIMLLFLYRITGGLTADEKILAERVPQGVVAVMGTNITESEEEREILQEVTGEPFGYMGGEWNLWEYIGDLMASLLMGG